MSYTEDNALFSFLCLHVSLFVSPFFSLCLKLTVISVSSSALLSPSFTCFLFSVFLSVCVCASLSSDRSCWAFLLSHEVSSYGNPFITDTQTCTDTHTHTDTPVIHLSSYLNGDEHFLLPASLLHLFPLSQCCHVLQQKDRKQWERQKTKRMMDSYSLTFWELR